MRAISTRIETMPLTPVELRPRLISRARSASPGLRVAHPGRFLYHLFVRRRDQVFSTLKRNAFPVSLSTQTGSPLHA